MSSLSSAKKHRLGLAVVSLAVCIAFGLFANAALAADAPKVTYGGPSQLTDNSTLLEFAVGKVDGKNPNVTVYYGKKDAEGIAQDWDNKVDKVKPDEKQKPGDFSEYTVLLKDLDPDTDYFYRIKATMPDGEEIWSGQGKFQTKEAPTPWHIMTLRLLMVAAMLIVPFIVGGWLAGSLRMPEYGWKLGVILFALVWGVFFVSTQRLKLGIDLSGGVVLVYEIEEDTTAKPVAEKGEKGEEGEEEAEPEKEKEDAKKEMDRLVSAMQLRVDPGGTRNVDIREYGEGRIQVTIPRASPEEVRRIREKLVSAGTLEFRILADTGDHKHKEVIALARQTDDKDVYNSDHSELLGRWVPIYEGEEDSFATYSNIVTREVNLHGKQVTQVLVAIDPYNVTGEYLSRCSGGFEQENGRPCVFFNFNNAGGHLFGEFTRVNKPETEGGLDIHRKLGIILNGDLYSAPRIQEKITNRGRITGSFTQEEVDDLVDVLNAGSLPAQLSKNPISELNSGPELGKDTIYRGTVSIILSLIVVLAFMLIYYRFAGMVACGALLMNLILLLGIMMALKVDFTLPGIAGLVLTVGMAVDANVLIFERIREELAKQAALRMAIRNGFARALSAIVDANLTTLITATLLWAIGTPQIKGFAVVLWLGVVLSMFTAIFCSRVVFDIAERKRWIKNLNMMHIIRHTNFNFIGMRYIGGAISITLIVIGLVSVVARGPGLLDIDFTGGEEVQVLFSKAQNIEDVRKVLETAKDANNEDRFPDVAVRDAMLGDEDEGIRYMITTSRKVSEADSEKGCSAVEVVEIDFIKTFHAADMKLATNQMTIGEMTTIGAPSGATNTVEPEKSPVPEAAEPKAPATETKTPEVETKAPEAETKTPEPADNEQTRNDLPPSTVLAMADSSAIPAMLLAQADPVTEEPPADIKPVEEPVKKDAEPKPAEEPVKKDTEPKPAEEPASTAKEESTDKPVEEKAETPTPKPVEPAAESDTATPKKVIVPSKYDGGTEVKLQFTYPLDYDSLKGLFDDQLAKEGLSEVPFDLLNESHKSGDTEAYPDWVLQIMLPQAELKEKVLDPISQKLTEEPHFPSSSSIGGKVAGDMQQKAIIALLGSLICIIGYLWLRFQRVSYGLAAVVALVHDVLITLGALAISAYLAPMLDPFKISLSVLAAFLTIIGYSLNDTIVVFDRIREVKGKSPELTGDMINTSINQTLSRTLLTSLTTLIVVLILFFGGGSGLHPFAYSLLIGVIVGTYSSIFVASPVLHWMSKPSAKKGQNTKKS